jgi:hypothetical protein
MTHLLLCSQQSITWPNDTFLTVFTTVHYSTMSWDKWHILHCSQQSRTWPCPQKNDTSLTVFTTVHNNWHISYCVHSSPLLDHVLRQMTFPLLCSQQSNTWPCSELNNIPVTVFTVVNCLTTSSSKWHNYFFVHGSPLLDHILRQMTHLLLCSQQSTTWPCSETNVIHDTVFTTIHCLNIFWAK